ncbi:MAG: NAD+ synthase [Oligoflexia bacterium]|nr:NAD+ synthase [Oligoflexia bacterium]
MRIALAQINPTLGDFKSNADKIIEFIKRAHEKRAHVVVFSEMVLFGYPATDCIENADVVAKQEVQLQRIIKNIPLKITAVFGAVIKNKSKMGKPFSNVAVIARKGKKLKFFAKQLLPTYDVFDETRFFEPGDDTGIIKIEGIGKLAISVCEDMWTDFPGGPVSYYKNDPMKKIKDVDLIINISASPFSKNKMQKRLETARKHVRKIKAPFVYVNQVGGQDELIFDGRSFILDEKGKEIVRAASCEEDLVMVDLASKRFEHRPQDESPIEIMRKALVLGIRDFINKTGQKKIHLGLSGGIDSALAAALAIDAVGPGNVTGILLPGPYSSKGSIDDSLTLAKNLKIKTETISIVSMYETSKQTMKYFSGDQAARTAFDQNLQARLRCVVLMAYSNVQSSMLLGTSNKSEIASGYSTLYGDLIGGLNPLGDLLKAEVYALAKHYNLGREIIPKEILDKAPSAELAPDQHDQESLPPYDELDKAVVKLVELKKSPSNKTENWLADKLISNEFKRWQSPPILRVSEHAFGRGRRKPIAFKNN